MLIQNCNKNDFIIFTIDVKSPDNHKDRLNILSEFDEFVSPAFKKKKNIKPNDFTMIIQDIILNYIDRYAQFANEKFQKIFSFYYKDSTPMYTIGGFLCNDEEFQEIQEKMDSSSYFVAYKRNEIVDVDVPILTYREKLFLDKHINKLIKLCDKDNTLIKKEIDGYI